MSVRYAPNLLNTGPSNTMPEGFTDAQWHVDASGDTGTSHILAGRLYIVQCEWCPEAFAARTKAEAVAMFREHEDAIMAQTAFDLVSRASSTTGSEQ